VLFQTFNPESLSGSLDYDIESTSSAVSEGQKRADAMSLLQVGAATIGPGAVPALFQDVLEAFGKKDIQRYMPPPPQPQEGGAGGLEALLGGQGGERGAAPPGGPPPPGGDASQALPLGPEQGPA
jgi:hypothetical protein